MKAVYYAKEKPYLIGDIRFLTVCRQRGHRVAFPSGRPYHSFLFTYSGAMQYHFYDTETPDIVAVPGSLVFIPSKICYHSIYLHDDSTVGLIQFTLIDGALPPVFAVPSQFHSDPVEEIFHLLRIELLTGVGDNPVYFLYHTYELLWRLSMHRSNVPYKFRKLQNALKELHLRYYENHKVAYYANMSDMSEPGFRRLFLEYTGRSPIEYRNQIRLQRARDLILSGEYQIAEAAECVGFSNLSFFYRSYKQAFGCNPGKEIFKE